MFTCPKVKSLLCKFRMSPHELATFLGYRVGYLGLPLCMGNASNSLWDHAKERVKEGSGLEI